MISIIFKDKTLRKSSKVRKWEKICEKMLNDKFPQEKLDKMRAEIATDMMIYGNSIMDSDGNRIDPMKIYKIKNATQKEKTKT